MTIFTLVQPCIMATDLLVKLLWVSLLLQRSAGMCTNIKYRIIIIHVYQDLENLFNDDRSAL